MGIVCLTFNFTILNLLTIHDSLCIFVCVASGTVGPLHEDERGAATQAECDAGPAEEHRGEKGRHGG